MLAKVSILQPALRHDKSKQHVLKYLNRLSIAHMREHKKYLPIKIRGAKHKQNSQSEYKGKRFNTFLIVSVYEMPKLSSSLFTHILQPPTKIVGKAENERLDYNKI